MACQKWPWSTNFLKVTCSLWWRSSKFTRRIWRNSSASLHKLMDKLSIRCVKWREIYKLDWKNSRAWIKLNQMEICSPNRNSFRDSDSDQDNSSDGKKFKEIGNFIKPSQFDPISVSLNTSSAVRILHVKNSSSMPYSTGENAIVNKLNLLSVKIHKI